MTHLLDLWDHMKVGQRVVHSRFGEAIVLRTAALTSIERETVDVFVPGRAYVHIVFKEDAAHWRILAPRWSDSSITEETEGWVFIGDALQDTAEVPNEFV